MSSRPLLTASCLALGLAVSACGSSDEDPAPGARDVLTPPARADCSADRLATSATPDDLAPRAGTYRYRLAGSRQLTGERSAKLTGDMTLTATPSRRFGNVTCFRLRRALARDVVETATLAVRGNKLYITQAQSAVGGQQTLLAPDPPILAADPDRLSWTGTFSGATSGRYSAEVVGRRRFEVGGRSVRAVGVRLTLALRGELEGSERSLQWLATGSNLVLREEVAKRRAFGVDELRLDYRAGLRAVTPRP